MHSWSHAMTGLGAVTLAMAWAGCSSIPTASLGDEEVGHASSLLAVSALPADKCPACSCGDPANPELPPRGAPQATAPNPPFDWSRITFPVGCKDSYVCEKKCGASGGVAASCTPKHTGGPRCTPTGPSGASVDSLDDLCDALVPNPTQQRARYRDCLNVMKPVLKSVLAGLGTPACGTASCPFCMTGVNNGQSSPVALACNEKKDGATFTAPDQENAECKTRYASAPPAEQKNCCNACQCGCCPGQKQVAHCSTSACSDKQFETCEVECVDCKEGESCANTVVCDGGSQPSPATVDAVRTGDPR